MDYVFLVNRTRSVINSCKIDSQLVLAKRYGVLLRKKYWTYHHQRGDCIGSFFDVKNKMDEVKRWVKVLIEKKRLNINANIKWEHDIEIK